jgi:8-oxo-dGTP pyrophosphatase MutT (NUDIX family)
MIETFTKSSSYLLPSHQNQSRVFNKAFQSLSFRGNKGYSNNLITRQSKKAVPSLDELLNRNKRVGTYGAILITKTISGVGKTEILYALVQGRYTGKWSFPKGHSNEGELPIVCALREVAEETGIDELPEPIEYLQIGYGNYFVFTLPDTIPLIPRDTNEIMDTKWVTLDEMKKMELNADASLFRKKMSGVNLSQ